MGFKAGIIRSGALAFVAAAPLLADGASAQQQKEQPPRQPAASPRTTAPAQPAPSAAPRTTAPAQPAPATPGTQAPLPGAPWAAPVLTPGTQPRAAQPAGPPQPRGPLPVSMLKPAEKDLIDCAQAPKTAVIKLPEPLAKWATIHCTREGHILTSNERYYSELPGTRGRLRGVLSAAQIGGNRRGELGHSAHFTKIDYAPLPPADAQKLMAGIDPAILQIVRDKPLFRLELTTDNGQVYKGVVVDPSRDAFWVIHIKDEKLARGGFTVATVDYVNKRRMQQ